MNRDPFEGRWLRARLFLHLGGSMKLTRFVFLVVLVWCATVAAVRAQSDYPTRIVFLVRDAQGNILDPAKLDAVVSPKGEEMKASTTFIEHADGSVTRNVKCLESRLHLGGGPVHLSELTLTYQGKKMRLLFHATAKQERKLIDSIPFREGTYKLSQNKWVEEKR